MQVESARAVGMSSARRYVPWLIILAYLAFLTTGFGTRLGAFQPVPVYIFFSVLLLTLQMAISENHSVARMVYVLLTSGFAIVYAGERVFSTSTHNFTRSPYTYIIINALLLLVFVYDAIERRRAHPRSLDFSVAARFDANDAGSRPTARSAYGAWATDFAGLAVIFFIAAFLLDLLGPQNLLRRLGLPHGTGKPYVGVDLNSALHLHLQAPINLLQNLDLVVALLAASISLLLLVIIGALVVPESRQEGGTGYGHSLDEIVKSALKQVLLALQLVLGPLFWLIPAFSIAAFAQQITIYLRYSSRFSASSLWDLFNPFSKTSQVHISQGLGTIGLGVLAIVSVIVSVVVVEENRRIISRAIKIVEETGRVVALTWAFFLYSLAMLNAVVVLGGFTRAEPFQVGAPGIIALLAGLAFAIVTPGRQGRRASAIAAQPRMQGASVQQ
jgi:hypothetical protein